MPNPNPQHNPTDGLGVAAYVQVTGTNVTNPSGGTLAHPGSNGANGQGIGATAGSGFPSAQYALTLSLTAAGGKAATCQLAPVIVDVKNNVYPGSLVLTQAAIVGSVVTYTGTITGGGSNAFAGMTVTIAGFVQAGNNGSFLVTASTVTTLVVTNAAGVNETHAGTANAQVGTAKYFSYGDPANKAGSPPAWYNPSNFSGYDPNVASVSSSGLITSRALGQTVIEVAFPVFDNTLGTATQAQKEPFNMIYTQVLVTVIP